MPLLTINSDSTIYLSSSVLCWILQENVQIDQAMHFGQCLSMGCFIRKQSVTRTLFK